MDRFFDWLIVALVVVMVCLTCAAIWQSQQLYRECRADGHKAYECHGIMRGHR